MTNEALLETYGLFNAKVPRYTSYPPATRFEAGLGETHQRDWMRTIRDGEHVSIYIHIPFCKRLCWFCACRTQGTQTLSPVEGYIDTLVEEIAAARALMPARISMARLHLGGGTPTILPPALMEKLLGQVFGHFATSPDFEFSVEIDPTDAAPELLKTLGAWGMNRASIGVQDFAPKVQKAIGRPQSFEQTQLVVDELRAFGITSLNMDLLYGLPLQTRKSMMATLDQVLNLSPDRLALFGYAHVPNMSKRQILIDEAALPSTRMRYDLSTLAATRLVEEGFATLGIDHFALPGDSLALAKANLTMRRNFQGYTDDPCDTLVGFGASAISQYRQGFVQNAVATGAYRDRIAKGGIAGHKGYVLTPDDRVIGRMVQALMCYGGIDLDAARAAAPEHIPLIEAQADALATRFHDAMRRDGAHLMIKDAALPLTRIIAATMDAHDMTEQRYSLAV